MQKIKPIGKDLGWLDAREAVKDLGGLPSNVLHDQYLVETDRYKDLDSSYYAAWARELLVYPAKDAKFEKGKDVVDAYKDDKGRQWIFPARFIPASAIGKEKTGLFVDPLKVEVTDEKVTIIPKKVVVINNFLQTDAWGKVDPQTRVPFEVDKKTLEILPQNQMRKLWRISGAGVRPLARLGVFDFVVGRVVYADVNHYWRLGVAGVEGTGKKSKSIAIASSEETFLTTTKPKNTIRYTDEIKEVMQLKVGQRIRVTIEKV